MNCQRYKPAEFTFIKPMGVQKDLMYKGVPQVDMSILQVSESFHAPPAYSLSNNVFVNYPPEELPIPDTTPKFYRTYDTASVKPHNFVSKYQELSNTNSSKKSPPESIKHPGQRMLG